MLGLEPSNRLGLQRRRLGAATRSTFLARMGDPDSHSFAQDLALELGEDRQRAGYRETSRRDQIQPLAQASTIGIELSARIESSG